MSQNYTPPSRLSQPSQDSQRGLAKDYYLNTPPLYLDRDGYKETHTSQSYNPPSELSQHIPNNQQALARDYHLSTPPLYLDDNAYREMNMSQSSNQPSGLHQRSQDSQRDLARDNYLSTPPLYLDDDEENPSSPFTPASGTVDPIRFEEYYNRLKEDVIPSPALDDPSKEDAFEWRKTIPNRSPLMSQPDNIEAHSGHSIKDNVPGVSCRKLEHQWNYTPPLLYPTDNAYILQFKEDSQHINYLMLSGESAEVETLGKVPIIDCTTPTD